MEKWFASKAALAWCLILFAMLFAAFYVANVLIGAANPLRNTLLFAGGVIVLAALTAAVFALVFSRAMRFIGSRSKKKPGEQEAQRTDAGE